jgi:hypothetical protein
VKEKPKPVLGKRAPQHSASLKVMENTASHESLPWLVCPAHKFEPSIQQQRQLHQCRPKTMYINDAELRGASHSKFSF